MTTQRFWQRRSDVRIQGGFSVAIDAPPEAVWPWIGNLNKHANWSPRHYQATLVSGTADTVGSRYRSVGWIPGDRNHANDVEITEVVPLERFALRSEDPMGTFESTYTLRRTAGGTEVTFQLVFPPLKGVAALAVPVMFPFIGKVDIRKRGALLKDRVEHEGLRGSLPSPASLPASPPRGSTS
jgi:uncharacterized protein YndB with AHSA1/START domain